MKKSLILIFCLYPFFAFGAADDYVVGGDIAVAGDATVGTMTSSGNIIADKSGTNTNSPDVSIKGDNSGNEIEGKLFLAYGADPYIVFSVDDDGTTPLLTDVLHLDNSSIRPASAGLLNLGSTGNYFNIAYISSLQASGDLMIGSDDGFRFSSTTTGIGGTADTSIVRAAAGSIDIGNGTLSSTEIRLDSANKKIFLDSADTDTYIIHYDNEIGVFAGNDAMSFKVYDSKMVGSSFEGVYGSKGFATYYLDTGSSSGAYLFGVVPYDANRGLNASSGRQYGVYLDINSEQTGTATYTLLHGNFDNTTAHAASGTDNYILNLSLTSGESFVVNDESDVIVTGGSGNDTSIITPECETLTFAEDPGDESKTASANGVLPAGSMLIGVTTKVTVAGTNCTSIDIGVAGDTDAFGNDEAITLDATTSNSDATAAFTSYLPSLAASAIVITANGGNCFALAIKVCPAYMTVTAP